jgi:hypothetical protein
LNQRRFEYWREAEIGEILALHDKRPDFLVETPVPIRFLLELTSFEQDTALDQIDPSVRVFSLGAMSLQKRANRLVRDAAEQLVPYATNSRPAPVMLDNYRQKGISLDKHTLGCVRGDTAGVLNPTDGGDRSATRSWGHHEGWLSVLPAQTVGRPQDRRSSDYPIGPSPLFGEVHHHHADHDRHDARAGYAWHRHDEAEHNERGSQEVPQKDDSPSDDGMSVG